MPQLAIFVVLLLPLLVRPACGLVKKDALDSELLQPDASRDSNGSINGSYINCGFDLAATRQYIASPTIPPDWPCTWKTLKTALSMNKKTILCIGDSITFGRDVKRQAAYPAKLHTMLDDEFNVVNLGVSWALASSLRGRRSYSMFPQAHVALNFTSPAYELDVAAVIVQLGTNDLKEGWNATAFHQDYYTFALRLMTAHPKAAFVFSIPPMRGAANVDVDKDLAREIKSVQAELQRAPGHAQSALVNMQDYFAAYRTEFERISGRPPTSLFQDGKHPTKAGYSIYGAAMARALRRMLGLSPKQASSEFEEAWLQAGARV